MRLKTKRALHKDSAAFTLLLGALVTLASFATDMGLPVLSETARSLGVQPSMAALTLSVFMVGFALGPLSAGPLSDRFGRRPLLLAGCATFALCGGMAAFAGSLPALLAWRFLMGAGAGACQVLVTAAVRDLFSGHEARVRQSYVSLAGGIAPIVAPSLGVWIAAAGGWRAIYAALAAGGAVLLAGVALGFGESARPRPDLRLTVRGTVGSYARVARDPLSMGYALVVALTFGCHFAYVASSSLVMIDVLGVSREVYGYLFASTAAGLMAGAFASARLSRRGVPHARLLWAGLAAVSGVAVTLLVLALAGLLSVGLLIPLVMAGNVAQGVVRPQAVQAALEPMADEAGVASAVMSGLQMLAAALASAAAAALFDGRSALAMAGTMAVCAVAALAVYGLLVRPAERRRAVEPGRAAPDGRRAAA